MKLKSALPIVALALICAYVQAVESEKVDLGGGVVLEIVQIPAGHVEMGSPPDEKGRGPDEEQHRVEIAEPFWLARYPVTRGQFARFVQESGYKTEAEKGTSGGFGFDGSALVQRKEFTWRNPGFEQTDEHPVVLITYGDALAFARWLSEKSHRPVSLPSEAQWEYACRAGTTTRYYSGDADEDAGTIAWHKDNAGKGTKPVAGKQANAFGLHDMCGNVYEWCADLYAPYVPGGGVQGPMDKPRRVLRGGSWLKNANHVRSAARARNTPGSRNADNGFRVVLGPPAVIPPMVAPGNGEAPPPTGPTKAHESTGPAVVVESPDVSVPVEPEPPPLSTIQPPAESAGGAMTAALVLVVVLGLGLSAIVIAVILVAKRASASSEEPSSLDATTMRVQDDGFWFDTSGYKRGDVVTYSYRTPSGQVSESFEVEPSSRGQFIYTGARPEDVLIAGLIADDVLRHQQSVPPPREQTRPHRTDDEDRGFRGFPSAY